MAAVTAAITLPFHNGRTEGLNTKTNTTVISCRASVCWLR
jgi:hypothetical protein